MLDIGFITLFAHTNERSMKFSSLRKLLLAELKLDSAYRFTKGRGFALFPLSAHRKRSNSIVDLRYPISHGRFGNMKFRSTHLLIIHRRIIYRRTRYYRSERAR